MRLFIILISLLFITACTSSKKPSAPPILAPPATPIQAEPVVSPIDPYEHYNHNAYRFNNKVDRAIFKPLAKGYKAITPGFFRTGVTHFFNNINEIPRFANDVLQGNFYWAMNDMWRFLINTTVGILGLFDVAEKLDLHTHQNFFSFTLDSWGAKPSPYVMLPFFGPSFFYDIYGIPMDFYLSPWGATSSLGPISIELGYGMFALNTINLRANFLQNEDLMNQVAVDRYIFFRTAFLQARKQQLALNNNPPVLAKANDADQEELYTGD
jgi:phospholipid-binding lipoprotein MlaA